MHRRAAIVVGLGAAAAAAVVVVWLARGGDASGRSPGGTTADAQARTGRSGPGGEPGSAGPQPVGGRADQAAPASSQAEDQPGDDPGAASQAPAAGQPGGGLDLPPPPLPPADYVAPGRPVQPERTSEEIDEQKRAAARLLDRRAAALRDELAAAEAAGDQAKAASLRVRLHRMEANHTQRKDATEPAGGQRPVNR